MNQIGTNFFPPYIFFPLQLAESALGPAALHRSALFFWPFSIKTCLKWQKKVQGKPTGTCPRSPPALLTQAARTPPCTLPACVRVSRRQPKPRSSAHQTSISLRDFFSPGNIDWPWWKHPFRRNTSPWRNAYRWKIK